MAVPAASSHVRIVPTRRPDGLADMTTVVGSIPRIGTDGAGATPTNKTALAGRLTESG